MIAVSSLTIYIVVDLISMLGISSSISFLSTFSFANFKSSVESALSSNNDYCVLYCFAN